MTGADSLPELRFPATSRPWWHVDFWLVWMWLTVLFVFWLIQDDVTGFELLSKVVISLDLMVAFSFVLSLIPPKPIVILARGELVIRRPALIRSREWRFPVSEVERIEIYGPAGRRYWRVCLKGRDAVDIPPVYDVFINRSLTDFMRVEVSEYVRVVVKKPPGLMAEVRGDFD